MSPGYLVVAGVHPTLHLSPALLQETLEFWDLINTQDINICESVQLGTSGNAYQGGRFSFRFEEPVHRFQNMVIDKMLVDEPARYRIPEGDADFDVAAYDAPPQLDDEPPQDTASITA